MEVLTGLISQYKKMNIHNNNNNHTHSRATKAKAPPMEEDPRKRQSLQADTKLKKRQKHRQSYIIAVIIFVQKLLDNND